MPLRAARPFFALGRALYLTTARALLPAAAGLLEGTVLVAAIPFGPDGVHPVDVVRAMARWPGARIAFWAAWLVVASPVCALLIDRSWMRTLPVRTWHAVAWLLGWGLVAQAPWVLLFGLGEGALRGLANGLLALTLGTAPVVGGVLDAGAAAALALVPLPVAVVFPAAAIVAARQVHRAWVAGPREPLPPMRLVRRSPAVVAVASVAVVALAREHRLRVLRVFALGGAVASAVHLLHVHQPVASDAEAHRALGILAIPAAAGAAWLTVPLVQLTASLEPMTLAMGRSLRVLHIGNVLVVSLFFVLFGAASVGSTLGWGLAIQAGPWSAALALLVLRASRGADPSKVVVRAAVVGTAGLVLELVGGAMALPVVTVAAVLVTAREVR